jgi:hypothetical protein
MLRGALLAIALLVAASPAMATGVCSGTRDCPLTPAFKEAQRNWTNCLLKSAPVHLAKTTDVNAAMAAVFADCSIEEDGVFAQAEIDWHLTADDEAKLRAITKAGQKAKLLDLMRGGPAFEKCRRAVKEGASSC